MSEMQMRHAIADALRWHYYDMRLGDHSCDPEHTGIDSDYVPALEACLPADLVERLRADARDWFAKARYARDWEEARNEILGGCPPPEKL